MAALNAAVHPAVEAHSMAWHLKQTKAGHPYTLKEAALLVALQKEATDRGIDITGKSIEELKMALNQYTGGFPLNQYPEIFKVNQVAIYINTNERMKE